MRTGAVRLILLGIALALGLACEGPERARDGDENLLRGRAPSDQRGVSHPDRLTDEIAAREGDGWDSSLTSVFDAAGAFVEFDLGASVPLTALYLQADNNEAFLIFGADESRQFRPLWRAPDVEGPGLRERWTSELDARVRYLRIEPRGGDASIALSELQAFAVRPEVFPPALPRLEGRAPGDRVRAPLLFFAVVAGTLLLLHSARWPALVCAAVVLATCAAGGFALRALVAELPLATAAIDLVRAVAAAVTLAAIARLALRPAHVMQRYLTGTLAAMALLAITAFYNFGAPQFPDAASGGRTYVHTFDMRVYFPTAKYFHELGYDGVYAASVSAFAADVPASKPRLADMPMRDLRSYEVTRVRDQRDLIDAVRARFEPERWDAFRHDMGFFRATMGPRDYLSTLTDHGANATPAWLLLAHALFRSADASQTSLLLAAALDPALLLLFFGVAWRSFGVRAALVCLVVYGSTAFPMFGTNWAGATLRSDWMCLLGMGVCALKVQRWALGGALLAGAAMLRAFPAFAVVALPVPALWWLVERVAAERRLPSRRELLDAQRPLLRATCGVAACVVLLTLASGAAFGFGHSWGVWSQKIGLHAAKPNVNHVGLRTVVQFDEERSVRAAREQEVDWAAEQLRTFERRAPVYYGLAGLYTAAVLLACRRREMYQAALVGTLLVPIWLYPANYYLHGVFVLPLLFDPRAERRPLLWGWVCACVLLLCVAQYFGWDAPEADERFASWSRWLLVAYGALLAPLAWGAGGREESQA